MPDGFDTTEMAQRGMGPRGGGLPRGGGFPGGGMGPGGGLPRGGGFPGRFPGGGFRRFPRRFPIRRFPSPIVFPFFFGFPQQRCFFIDQFGRCCDQFGRCCDRFGRCTYGDFYPYASAGSAGSWYGVPGSWDMMAYEDSGDEMADAESAAVFNDTEDYDYEV